MQGVTGLQRMVFAHVVAAGCGALPWVRQWRPLWPVVDFRNRMFTRCHMGQPAPYGLGGRARLPSPRSRRLSRTAGGTAYSFVLPREVSGSLFRAAVRVRLGGVSANARLRLAPPSRREGGQQPRHPSPPCDEHHLLGLDGCALYSVHMVEPLKTRAERFGVASHIGMPGADELPKLRLFLGRPGAPRFAGQVPPPSGRPSIWPPGNSDG